MWEYKPTQMFSLGCISAGNMQCICFKELASIEGKLGIIRMKTTEKKRHNGKVLLLLTTTCSVSRDKAKSTAWQLLKNRDRDTDLCVCIFLIWVFVPLAHQRQCLLWMSISLSEVGLTETLGDKRRGSSKHRKNRWGVVNQMQQMHAGRKEDRLAAEEEDGWPVVFTSCVWWYRKVDFGLILSEIPK